MHHHYSDELKKYCKVYFLAWKYTWMQLKFIGDATEKAVMTI